MAVTVHNYPFARNDEIWETPDQFQSLFYNPQNMEHSERRLKTYICWPKWAPDLKDKLVAAGMHYTGFSDIVKCYSCGNQFDKWQNGESPRVRHQRESPKCEINLKFRATTDSISGKLEVSTRKTKQSTCKTVSNLETDGKECMVKQKSKLHCDGARIIQEPKKKSKETKQPKSSKQQQQKEPHTSTIEKSKFLTAAVETVKQLGYSNDEVVAALKMLLAQKVDVNSSSLLDIIWNKENESCNTETAVVIPEPEEGSTTNTHPSENTIPGLNTKQEVTKEEDRYNKYVETKKRSLKDLIQKEMCVICSENRAITLLLPCAHMVTCPSCTETLSRCPHCQKIIRGTKEVFFV